LITLAVPDLVSPSYFPAIAAIDLGFFEREGLEVDLKLIYPVDAAYQELRAGRVEIVCGSAHSVVKAFPNWEGAQLLGALSQGMYWKLVMLSELGGHRGDLSVVKNKRIGAAPLVELGLKGMLADANIDLEKDNVTLVEVPPVDGSLSFGVNAARALEARQIDGFWANGMGAEVAERGGFGTLIVDARRGDGPSGAFDYTFPAMVSSEETLIRTPDLGARAVRALVATQNALRKDPTLATKVGKKRFPEFEANLIADVIARDLPYYSPVISERSFEQVSRFARRFGLANDTESYDKVVPKAAREFWYEQNPSVAPQG
jgi:ABC-type nitrate/sulfonate/bicarbonate transport system substrate-binding protein